MHWLEQSFISWMNSVQNEYFKNQKWQKFSTCDQNMLLDQTMTESKPVVHKRVTL